MKKKRTRKFLIRRIVAIFGIRYSYSNDKKWGVSVKCQKSEKTNAGIV